MNKVPKIISTKDLSYIEDMLNWNFYTSKKIHDYLDITEDKEVKKTLYEANELLIANYNKLLNILK